MLFLSLTVEVFPFLLLNLLLFPFIALSLSISRSGIECGCYFIMQGWSYIAILKVLKKKRDHDCTPSY